MAPCSVPSTTLRAGFAGAAMRHHGPHLRAAPTVDPGRDGGMASFSRTSECPVGPSQYRTGFVNLRVALSRKSTCRLTRAAGPDRGCGKTRLRLKHGSASPPCSTPVPRRRFLTRLLDLHTFFDEAQGLADQPAFRRHLAPPPAEELGRLPRQCWPIWLAILTGSRFPTASGSR